MENFLTSWSTTSFSRSYLQVPGIFSSSNTIWVHAAKNTLTPNLSKLNYTVKLVLLIISQNKNKLLATEVPKWLCWEVTKRRTMLCVWNQHGFKPRGILKLVWFIEPGSCCYNCPRRHRLVPRDTAFFFFERIRRTAEKGCTPRDCGVSVSGANILSLFELKVIWLTTSQR
jgi:hypothetical protein